MDIYDPKLGNFCTSNDVIQQESIVFQYIAHEFGAVAMVQKEEKDSNT